MIRLFLLLPILFCSYSTTIAQVKIGNNPSIINNNSLLELESTNKGLLLPRLTNAQMTGMVNPPAGMFVFNTTDSSLYIRRISGWNIVAAGLPSSWNLNGNDIYNGNSGNVGIGTSTPQKPLDIAVPGGIQISRTENASDSNEIFFKDNGQIRSLDNFHRIVFNRSNDQMEFHEFGNIIFKTGNPLTEAMRINTNGKVGIGTTLPVTPNNLLSVAGGITVDYNNQNIGTIANAVSFGSSGDAGIGSYRPGTSPVNYHGLDFYTNYTKRVSIDAAGNVGIGTATPAAKLDVEGTLKFADGSQGDGKILTSDADGNAYWKGVVGCSAGNCCDAFASDTINSGSIQTLVLKNEIYDNGGNNYDPVTGIFTAPSDGIYNCSIVTLLFQYGGSTSASDNIFLRMDKNNNYYVSSQSYYSGAVRGQLALLLIWMLS